ncbi:hypothetical protein [Azospirillum sp. ST 5-10]|uniref:hypothetical protein n=1 Tax=unclassified Azospirillum TaxID=2630922 RepID=UPI003F4A489E
MIDRDERTLARRRLLDEGHRLGLPADWLRHLPRALSLPGNCPAAARGMDTFLTWKRQEMLARQGRLDELAPGLVVRALEEAAAADGPRRLREAAEWLMFALVWPRRGASLLAQQATALADLRHCLAQSPSMHLFADLPDLWRSARDAALRLDDRLDLPSACPWPSLAALMEAAEVPASPRASAA